MIKKILLGISVSLVLGLLFVELLGRFLGFTNFPMIVQSDVYEYFSAPNQDVLIFRNRFQTNAQGMRSKALSKKDKIRILLIGDSIVFGGNQTEQDSLASSMLEARLTSEFGEEIRVLNISVGSWGPDNAVAYLKQHGLYDADMIVTVWSSHDALDVMFFDDLEKYPATTLRQEPLALIKIWKKYVSPALFGSAMDKSSRTTPATEVDLNPGFQDLYDLANANELPFFFYLHAEQPEVTSGKLYQKGTWIKNFLTKNQVDHITDLESGITVAEYRDIIHPNNQGQRFIADLLYPKMKEGIRLAKLKREEQL